MTTARTAGPPAAAPAPTPAPAPDQAPTAASSGLRGRLSGWSASARSGMEGTPGRLTGLAVLTVLAALLFGLAAAYAFRSADGALTRAGANTDQLVRVQAIQTKLIQADADATNAFLVGGLEPADERAKYDAAIASAANGLARLAGSKEADAELLGKATAGLTTYTGLVEQARANNRQGFPVGAAYLDQASAVLRSDVLPELDSLVSTNANRVDSSFAAVAATPWILALGVIALVVFVVVQTWLARRTHRRLNSGLFWATILALVASIAGALVLGTTAQKASDVQRGPYDDTFAVFTVLE